MDFDDTPEDPPLMQQRDDSALSVPRWAIWTVIGVMVVMVVVAVVAICMAVNNSNRINNGSSSPTLCCDTLALFVNQQSGSDSAAGTSAASALKSITQAMNNIITSSLCAGGRASIEVMGGQYAVESGAVWMTALSTTQSRGITVDIRGAAAESVVLEVIPTSITSLPYPSTAARIILPSPGVPATVQGGLLRYGSLLLTYATESATSLLVANGTVLTALPAQASIGLVAPGTQMVLPLATAAIAVGPKDHLAFSQFTLSPAVTSAKLTLGMDPGAPVMMEENHGLVSFQACFFQMGKQGETATLDVESVTPLQLATCYLDNAQTPVRTLESLYRGASLTSSTLNHVDLELSTKGSSAIYDVTAIESQLRVSGAAVTVDVEGTMLISDSTVAAFVADNACAVRMTDSWVWNAGLGVASPCIRVDNGADAALDTVQLDSASTPFELGPGAGVRVHALSAQTALAGAAIVATLELGSSLMVLSGTTSLMTATSQFTVAGGAGQPVGGFPAVHMDPATASTFLAIV